MNQLMLDIGPEQAGKVAEVIRRIATRAEPKAAPMTSWRIAEIFGRPHWKVYDRIARFITANATEEEKREFSTGKRVYGRGRVHPIWELTEAGCKIYAENLRPELVRSKALTEGMKRFREEVEKHFHARDSDVQAVLLMQGRSRTECSYIKELFDRFITGPAIEDREIEELSEKYEVFHQVMQRVRIPKQEAGKVEDAVMGIAIEAEMQGFIYGFKVFELLADRAMATA